MAGAFSKFNEAVRNKTCADFVHVNLNCNDKIMNIIKDAVIGSARFYLPICIVPVLIKFKNWRKYQTWKQFLQNFYQCMIFGVTVNIGTLKGVCAYYKIFKKFHLSTVICLPVSLTGISCYFLPHHILRIEGMGLFNFYIEFLIKRARSEWIIKLRESKLATTFMFSLLNTCIMYGLLQTKSKNFWFTKLNIPDEIDVESKCIHGNLSCFEYFQKELKQIVKFAFGIGAVKAFAPRLMILLKKPHLIPKLLIQKFDYRIFMFFISINSIFKFLFCYLNRYSRFSMNQNCVISSMISSVAYLFYPKYIVFTMAITNAIEMLYRTYEKILVQKHQKLPKLMQIINKIPWLHILLVYSVGMNVQLRVLYPNLVNKFVHKFFTVASNGRGDEVALNLLEVLIGSTS